MQARLSDFQKRPAIDSAEYTVGEAGPYIRFSWDVDVAGQVYIEAHDDLVILGPKRVARKFYNYHATIVGGPDVVRYGSPSPGYDYNRPAYEYGLQEEDHHKFHHRHLFHPLQETAEDIQALNLEETPTLPEFMESAARWYHQNREDILGQF